ncbi:FtsK/SpoIIIE domain-containing protein [Bifidobacterium gallicum]|nr:FtsK/SpoIIIE domain-containing protein [Bifidobacterium gallicum]
MRTKTTRPSTSTDAAGRTSTAAEAAASHRHAVLRRVAMGAPMLAQCVLCVAMIVQRQWLFAMMVGSGCIGSLATMLGAMAGPRAPGRDNAGGSYTTLNDMQSPADTEAMCALLRDTTVPALETLCGITDDMLPWQRISTMWQRQGERAQSLNVPVGVTTGGVTYLDLVNHGPHAIVAGTTGSGKSVLLRSWCMSMALHHSPEALQFVFLDFKGGSSLDGLRALPHARGCVSDLDLNHATRALQAMEHELRRREQLAATYGVADLRLAPHPVARLVIIVDEFHALHAFLPDYVERLVRVASLGRSLCMHVVACTQNPMAQISTSMKANMGLRICLRVQDSLQSHELLGTDAAAKLPADLPGCALATATGAQPFRVSNSDHTQRLLAHISFAARFMHMPHAAPLFTPPLPTQVDADAMQPYLADIGHIANDLTAIPLGLADDGVTYHAATVNLQAGNVAIIGASGRGKTTVLTVLRLMVPDTCAYDLRFVDDADALLDPMASDDEALAFRCRLNDTQCRTVFAVRSSRWVHVPEHCATRIIFPTGERGIDLADGVPAALSAQLDAEALATAGRAVLVHQGTAVLVQCAILNQ